MMGQMRERVARAICESTEADVFDELSEGSIYRAVYVQQADAALSIMQPEIDRRVAEEKARLLERLRTPSEEVIVDLAASLAAAISLLERGGKAAKKAAPSDKMFDLMVKDYKASLNRARKALTAFQQENSDG